MENLTVIQIRDFAIVCIALMGFVILLGNVIKTIKDWRRPGMDINTTVKDHGNRIETLEEGNKLICKALLAIMSHEIHGNSVDKLQKAYDDMNDYLVDK